MFPVVRNRPHRDRPIIPLPAVFEHNPGWGLILPAASPTLTIMLKLVESLGAKAERGKRTTVEYLPLNEGTSHHCAWCDMYAKGRPKGWHRLRDGTPPFPVASRDGRSLEIPNVA